MVSSVVKYGVDIAVAPVYVTIFLVGVLGSVKLSTIIPIPDAILNLLFSAFIDNPNPDIIPVDSSCLIYLSNKSVYVFEANSIECDEFPCVFGVNVVGLFVIADQSLFNVPAPLAINVISHIPEIVP